MKYRLFTIISVCTLFIADTYAIAKPETFTIKQVPREYAIDNSQYFQNWASYSVTDNSATWQADYINSEINVDASNQDNSAIITYQGIQLAADRIYNLQFELNSSINTFITIKVIDKQNNNVLITKKIATNQIHNIEIETSKFSNDVKIDFYLGENKAKTIISNLNFSTNDSLVKIKINQLGYQLEDPKQAIFTNRDGNYFEIIDFNTKQVVYQGAIVNQKYDNLADDYTALGDFSSLKTPGKYYIQSAYGNISYPFELKNNIYQDLKKSALKMLTSQRCGMALTPELFGDLAHEACHDDYAMAYNLGHELDVTGGWHDAGDYSKYTSTTEKTLMDLMLAYYLNPEMYDDDCLIPESGNSVSDLLDEIRYGLKYLEHVQMNDGSVFHKVVSKKFADFVAPEFDEQQLYALNPSTASTAYASACFMFASNLFKDIDPEYAEKLLDRSLKAKDFVENNHYIPEINPKEFQVGVYQDDEDIAERYLMYMTFGKFYHEDYYSIALNYSNKLNNLFNLDFNYPTMYGSYFFLNDFQTKYRFKHQVLLDKFTNYCNQLIDQANNSSYFNSLTNYIWGSNYHTSDNGAILAMAYKITKQQKYYDYAFNQLHYLLGRNALNRSFICEFGSNFPKNIHHRLTIAKHTTLKGAMVGGPNVCREDQKLTNDNNQYPPAKSYLDLSTSYATNEVAIYYNSSLILLLSID